VFQNWREIPCQPWRLSASEYCLYCKESLGSKPLVNKHSPKYFHLVNFIRWLQCLGLGSATACLLGLRDWIPPRAWLYVPLNVVCCQVQVSVTGWSLVQRSSTEWGLSECDKVQILTQHCKWVSGRRQRQKTEKRKKEFY
jgi:hypothetical protein